jgi:hypothetical protein
MNGHPTLADATARGVLIPVALLPRRHTAQAVERRLKSILDPYLTDANARASTNLERGLDGHGLVLTLSNGQRFRIAVSEWK